MQNQAIVEVESTSTAGSGGPDELQSAYGMIAFAAVGGALIVLGLLHCRNALLQYRAEVFPNVMGQMTHYEWDEFGTVGETQLVLEYNYAVNGRRYFGNRKRFAWREFRSESPAAVALAKSWGTGNRVKVFYDPDDPSRAALDNLFTPGDWKTLWCAIGALIIGTLICVALAIVGVSHAVPIWSDTKSIPD